MKKLVSAGLLTFLLACPKPIPAQEFGVGVRGGFLGLGGEAALSLTDAFAVRGGFGVFPFHLDGTYDDVDYTFTPPSSMATVGIDLYPGGGFFRIMGGIMIRNGDIELQTGDLADAGSLEIGDEVYVGNAGTISGRVKTNTTAPFVGIGFGHHTSPGFGVTVDLGVAFAGEANVDLDAQGPIRDVEGFLAELDKEEQYFEEDVGGFLKYWPIVSVGIKIPVR